MNSNKTLESNLCANGCGFFGSASTKKLCFKCYQDLEVVLAAFEKLKIVITPDVKPDRCFMCMKRVKIARGFKCRCGCLFCESHRYPEVHVCPFDYKSLGKNEIVKANPMTKADKMLERI